MHSCWLFVFLSIHLLALPISTKCTAAFSPPLSPTLSPSLSALTSPPPKVIEFKALLSRWPSLPLSSSSFSPLWKNIATKKHYARRHTFCASSKPFFLWQQSSQIKRRSKLKANIKNNRHTSLVLSLLSSEDSDAAENDSDKVSNVATNSDDSTNALPDWKAHGEELILAAALEACGITPSRWPSFATAFTSLQRSEIVRER